MVYNVLVWLLVCSYSSVLVGMLRLVSVVVCGDCGGVMSVSGCCMLMVWVSVGVSSCILL